MSAIPKSLERFTVAIDELQPYPRNPRRGDLDLLKASLEAHGQYRPVVVNRRTMQVLAGNHTLAAARALGWRKLAATFVDVDDDEAARIVLVDNRSNDFAVYDDDDLAALLSSLPDLDATGWDDADLDELLRELSDDDADDESDGAAPGPSFAVYDAERIVDAAFEHYRAQGFPYRSLPLHVAMSEINALAGLATDQLSRSRLAHHIADTYHPHRWHAHIDGAPNALDVFESDDKLRIALRHVVDYAYSWSAAVNVIGLTHGAQTASNFRPGFALQMLRRYAEPGAVVLDTSTGYGGRLVAFLASHCSRYVGIDPSSETHAANERLAADLCPPDKHVELHCLPAEDVPHELVAGRCDVALTSPPYFRKELYCDEETQSWRRYASADAWRDGFLVPMLALQAAALKPGGISVLNVADVTLRGSRETIPLVNWSLDAAAAAGFEHVATDALVLMRRWGPQEDHAASEPVLVLRKR